MEAEEKTGTAKKIKYTQDMIERKFSKGMNRTKKVLEKKINYERKWQKIQMIEMISQDESTNISIPGGLK